MESGFEKKLDKVIYNNWDNDVVRARNASRLDK